MASVSLTLTYRESSSRPDLWERLVVRIREVRFRVDGPFSDVSVSAGYLECDCRNVELVSDGIDAVLSQAESIVESSNTRLNDIALLSLLIQECKALGSVIVVGPEVLGKLSKHGCELRMDIYGEAD